MAFYFKGDQLFAKRAEVPEEERDDWTFFMMDLREPMEMPNLDDFAKFLTTSMVIIFLFRYYYFKKEGKHFLY